MYSRKLIPAALVLSVLIIFFGSIYVYRNKTSVAMSTKQKIIRSIYPGLMRLTKFLGKNSKMLRNKSGVAPQIAFYSLHATSNDGQVLPFENFKGKKVLLVNTASECGYTPQYDELQQLYKKYNGQLIVIGFPSNDFAQQEKGSDEQIALFCRRNYGVEFPLVKKSGVLKGPSQNEVYEWLSHRTENGWNDQQPSWNFSKYLVNEQGILTHYFDPSISPMSSELTGAIEENP